MSAAFRSYLKANNNVLTPRKTSNTALSSCFMTFLSRTFSDDKANFPEFINSTILVENGLNVQELPVVVRKLRDLSDIELKPSVKDNKNTQDIGNYNLIQAEFKQCTDLKDVFSLLSKCTKITPNIALGAMERIYDIEKNPNPFIIDVNLHINFAKGAILDKLLKVVMKTEDTQTILNILNTVSSFMDPYKHKFCEELLFRVIDNKLTIVQLCEFASFLINNKSDSRYSDTIDKLWVGFVEKENEINETNIVEVFKILPGLKVSKRIIFTELEQKLVDLWYKIKIPVMQEILNTFVEEKYSSLQSFAVVGRWLHTNIHNVDEESLLDVITKLTRLNYTDDQIERAVEKYVKLKGSNIGSHVLVVGILNYCMQFHIQNEHVLDACSNFFVKNGTDIPTSFLKSFIYPFGYLGFDSNINEHFWKQAELVLHNKFDKISVGDLSSIVLSFIYSGEYPLRLVSKMFSSEYLAKVNKSIPLIKLHLIDTALSLECDEYAGPLLPKDQWSKPITQDSRIKNIIEKIYNSLREVAGGNDKLSTAVLIPFLYSHETYLIDVMLHPSGLGSNTFNWKLKSARNENTAILIHLPDHYCSNNDKLIGPQAMRIRHLRLLGLKVVSLKYSVISQFYTSFNTSELRKYIGDRVNNAVPSL